MIIATRSGKNHATQFSISRGYYDDEPGYPFLAPVSRPDYAGAVGDMGLTSVAAAIRLISETIGSFIMRVYEGDAQQREPRLDAPTADVLQAGSGGYYTSFNLWEDVATQIEACGNGLIWKERVTGGRVVGLFAFPVETAYIYLDRETGVKRIEATIRGEKRDITSDVIHIRGWSPFADVYGFSTLTMHARALAGSRALEMFRGRFFDSDATPSLLLSTPNNLTQAQRGELRQSWQAMHGGTNGAKVGVLWGGMTAQQLSSTLAESQVAELNVADVLSVARMFRILPPWLLSPDASLAIPEAENTSDLFMRFTLLPRLRRIERAVSADTDLFPDPDLYARFDVGELLRGDIATTASKIHQLLQVGAISANEGRSELGYPPSDDPAADELQRTPVGGAPNAEQSEIPGFALTNGAP